jgi:predicted component of type VI protein secretion system
MAFRLIIRSEGGESREMDLPEAGLTLGRHASNAVKLEGMQVSRFHARVEPKGERVLVTDRDSYAGTWIDGALLDGSFELGHGDRFDIGEHEVYVVDAAKSFTLPKYTPPREEEDDLEEGDDDFFENKSAKRGLRVISVAPPPPAAEALPSPAGEAPIAPSATETRDASAEAKTPSIDAAAPAPSVREPESTADTPATKSDAAADTSTDAGPESKPGTTDVAPLPEFKITATSEALTAALTRVGQTVSRQHHRIVFLAPEPPRDPIGMRRAPISFGSAPECTVVCEGEGIRPQHATLAIEEGAIVLAASEGATVRVNGADVQRAELSPGDRVEIGNVTFVAASRAREHYTPAAKQTGWASSVPMFSPTSPSGSNARAWLFATLILAAGLGGMLFLLFAREPVRTTPEPPRTLPIESIDASFARTDATARDVPIVLSPAEIETRLDEARSDVESFETESALARLAVFHGRTDLPAQARIRAAMLEVQAYLTDNRPDDAARACARAIDAADGDVAFLAEESPRVRSLCGVAGDAGGRD